MAELAIKGGNKIRNKPFPNQLGTILDEQVMSNIKNNFRRKSFFSLSGKCISKFYGW
jgi:hypothetical protein